MKKIIASFVLLSFCVFADCTHAQQRSAGQAVVPMGSENADSLRFMLVGMSGAAVFATGDPSPGKHYVDSIADILGGNFQGEFGSIPTSTTLDGRLKGIMAYDAGTFAFRDFIDRKKQRVYEALPFAVPYRANSSDAGNNGYFWHYNAATGFDTGDTCFNNTYDANDISLIPNGQRIEGIRLHHFFDNEHIFDQKNMRRDSKCLCNQDKIFNCNIRLTALDGTDINSMQAGNFTKLALA